MNLIHTRIPAKPSSPAPVASSIKSPAILNLLKVKNDMRLKLSTTVDDQTSNHEWKKTRQRRLPSYKLIFFFFITMWCSGQLARTLTKSMGCLLPLTIKRYGNSIHQGLGRNHLMEVNLRPHGYNPLHWRLDHTPGCSLCPLLSWKLKMWARAHFCISILFSI